MLLGRDSWACFKTRSYRPLPCTLDNASLLRELSSVRMKWKQSPTPATPLLQQITLTPDFILFRPGTRMFRFLAHPRSPQLPSYGRPPIPPGYTTEVGNHGPREYFVSDGRQELPFGGSGVAQLGDVIGTHPPLSFRSPSTA